MENHHFWEVQHINYEWTIFHSHVQSARANVVILLNRVKQWIWHLPIEEWPTHFPICWWTFVSHLWSSNLQVNQSLWLFAALWENDIHKYGTVPKQKSCYISISPFELEENLPNIVVSLSKTMFLKRAMLRWKSPIFWTHKVVEPLGSQLPEPLHRSQHWPAQIQEGKWWDVCLKIEYNQVKRYKHVSTYMENIGEKNVCKVVIHQQIRDSLFSGKTTDKHMLRRSGAKRQKTTRVSAIQYGSSTSWLIPSLKTINASFQTTV